MRSIKLEELIPQPAKFTLSQTGKTYRMRRFNLEDEVWLQAEFGDQLEDILKSIKMKEVARIVFHQLEEEDKSDFLVKVVTIVDEDGEKKEIRLGGAKLLFALISGYSEKMAIYSALLETIGISRQLQDELTTEKNEIPTEKKSEQLKKLTGRKFSTRSLVNTDGPLKKSEDLHTGRSR